jgi:hypothetical protein
LGAVAPRAKPSDPGEAKIRWTTAAFFALTVRKGKRQLAVSIGPELGSWIWRVVALELPQGNGSRASAEKQLDDHRHHIVGDFDDVKSAIAAAEQYAREWHAGELAIGACECSEIPPVIPRAIDA